MKTYTFIQLGKQDMDPIHLTRFSFRTEIDHAARYSGNCHVNMFVREHVTDQMIDDLSARIDKANTPAPGCRLPERGEETVKYLRQTQEAMQLAQKDQSTDTAGYAVFRDQVVRIVYS